MDLRELVILVLGLTIVGVVVRGLLVALKARKSQLRLAIDKNLPKDIDLEAIELAELPSGGARVVGRSPDELHAANTESKADALLNIPVSKPVAVSLGILRLEFEESLETEGSEAPAESEGSEASKESEWSKETKETEETQVNVPAVAINPETERVKLLSSVDEIADEVGEKETNEPPAELTEDLSEELPDELPEKLPEEFPEERATDSAHTHTSSLGDGIDDDDDEYSSISLSAGDRIGGIKESPKMPSKKDSRGSSILGSLGAASRSLGALVASRKSDKTAPDAPDDTPLIEHTEANTAVPIAESTNDHSALFENYEQDQSAEASPSEASDIMPENDSPAVTDLFPETLAQEAAPEPEVLEPADASPAPLSPRVNEVKEQAAPAIEEKPKGAAVGEVSEVLVLNVTAKKGRLIMGERLLSLMQELELEYGERKIFSKRTDDAERSRNLFNVANMLQPGTFDLNNMENFATVGVTLFLALPSPISNFEAFEEMLQTAQDLVRSIDGELRDDQRNMMTGQTIEHYRQRVRDFELRRLRSRAAAG
ncbi:cell division protein ZipA [Gammaproteobacteria bacterium]|nr:cell division protein ZipA [Gammaproteobacteria bacterium]